MRVVRGLFFFFIFIFGIVLCRNILNWQNTLMNNYSLLTGNVEREFKKNGKSKFCNTINNIKDEYFSLEHNIHRLWIDHIRGGYN